MPRMGNRTSYAHGTFSWVDNATTDQEGAKSFYSTLFGWDYDDTPVGEGIVYSLAKLGDDVVGAIGPQQQDEISQGIPPHWNNYISVDDVDAAAGRVTELGGKLVVPPFDVSDVGRMAVLIDPSGAPVCLWQGGRRIGADLVNTPGSFTWNELATRDPEPAMAFYSELLGWTYNQIPVPGIQYWVIMVGERSNGGVRVPGEDMPETPSFWLPYFGTDDVEATANKAAEAGGNVLVGKSPANEGNYFAALQDPYGAVFAVFEGSYDD